MGSRHIFSLIPDKKKVEPARSSKRSAVIVRGASVLPGPGLRQGQLGGHRGISGHTVPLRSGEGGGLCMWRQGGLTPHKGRLLGEIGMFTLS